MSTVHHDPSMQYAKRLVTQLSFIVYKVDMDPKASNYSLSYLKYNSVIATSGALIAFRLLGVSLFAVLERSRIRRPGPFHDQDAYHGV